MGGSAFSSSKLRIGVRAVDPRVTEDAVPERRVRQVVEPRVRRRMPSARRPNPPTSLWHSRHRVKAEGRFSRRGFVLPCGLWHAGQPSTRTGGCSCTKGPRLSEWHLVQAMSFPRPCETMRGKCAVRQVASAAPCGLWQSEQSMAPSLTRCLNGMLKRASISRWQP